MRARDGKHYCSWCGTGPMAEAEGFKTPECCSPSCAKAYAKDIGKPVVWRSYMKRKSETPCSRCGQHNVNPLYRYCPVCRESHAAVMRKRRDVCVEPMEAAP